MPPEPRQSEFDYRALPEAVREQMEGLWACRENPTPTVEESVDAVRAIVSPLLDHYREAAVEPSDRALAVYRSYMQAAAHDGYVEQRLLRDGLRQILEAQAGRRADGG